ncbi:hypothetical protein Ancab_032465, partial [Ancistrocladus abbreviatus]
MEDGTMTLKKREESAFAENSSVKLIEVDGSGLLCFKHKTDRDQGRPCSESGYS